MKPTELRQSEFDHEAVRQRPVLRRFIVEPGTGHSCGSNDEAEEPPPVSVASGYEVFLKPIVRQHLHLLLPRTISTNLV